MKYLVAFCFYILAFNVHSDEPSAKQLQALLKNYQSVTADFVQHNYTGNGNPTVMKGTMAVMAPGKFRWKTLPDFEQLLVTNGTTLWLYDIDLANVTVQPLDKELARTPILMLGGNIEALNDAYDVWGEKMQDEQHFVLVPKSKEVLFDRLRLEFDKQGSIQRMEIKDEVGQKTIISFSHVNFEAKLDPATFEFVVPEGVDVITSN